MTETTPERATPLLLGPPPLQHYQAIVESSDDAIVGKLPDGVVLSWNPAAERMFGYTASEMIGRPITRIFPAERVPEEKLILHRLAAGQKIDHFETLRLHKSGRNVRVSVTISPIIDNHGRFVGASKIARDVTERVEAERRMAGLVQQARHHTAIIDSSDDAIISKTLDGTVTSWNAAAERMFGYRAEEMINRAMVTVFPKDRLDEETLILEKIRRGEKVEHFETVRLHRRGHPLHLSVTISPITDEGGRIVGASKIARDIGERVRAERQVWRQAHHDALTKMPNRRLFMERLGNELARAGNRFALMFIDLDGFKPINDTHGHQAGDQLLRLAAARIRSCIRASDVAARMGGDEFTVLLTESTPADHASLVAERIKEALHKPFALSAAAQVRISGSIGVAYFPDDGATQDELLAHADQALYEAKRAGRNQVRFFAGAK